MSPLALGTRRAGATASQRQLPGLEAWYRADLGVLDASDAPISADGTAIKTWLDQSTHLRHLVQATAGQRPVWKSAVINGLPTVRFLGSASQYFKSSAFTRNQPHTVFVVARQTTTDNSAVVDGAASFEAMIDYAGPGTQARMWAGGSIPNVACTTTNFNLLCAVFNGAGSKLILNDGAAETDANAGATNATGLTVAARGSLNSFLTGDIAELRIYSGDQSAAGISAVLKARYGL